MLWGIDITFVRFVDPRRDLQQSQLSIILGVNGMLDANDLVEA